MKEILIFILLFMPFSITGKKDNPLEQRAKNIAEEYYSSFQQLAIISDPLGDLGKRLEGKIMKMVGSDSNGNIVSTELHISNDIDPILGSEEMGKDVTISNYVGHYVEYAAKKDFSLSYKVVSCKQLKTPSLRGIKGGTQFVQIVVRKTYKFLKKSTDVDETMTITFMDDKTYMSSISNLYGTSQTSGDLFALALNKYSRCKYYEAFQLFEQVMKKSPGHTDASYYLGIMLYKNQGCKKEYPKRAERDKKAIEYWKMSSLGEKALRYYTDGRY